MPKRAAHGVLRSTDTIACVFATGTSAEEFLTDLVKGCQYVIEKVSLVVKVVGAGAGATRTFNVVKTVSGVDTTVATVAVTLAATATKGAIIDVPVTAANAKFANDTDSLSLALAAGGTAFTALEVQAIIRYRQHPQNIY